jgi:hypothetical protein
VELDDMSAARMASSKSLIDFWHPDAALLTSCFTAAWHLVMFRRRPFSITLILALSSLSKILAKFCDPRGRPAGFPD